jgi:hypothetical protein
MLRSGLKDWLHAHGRIMPSPKLAASSIHRVIESWFEVLVGGRARLGAAAPGLVQACRELVGGRAGWEPEPSLVGARTPQWCNQACWEL